MTSPEIPLSTLDATLARFRAAAEMASARLLDLDGDPVTALLTTGPLTGVTAARWAAAAAAQARLWNSRDLLSKLVADAEQVRGDGRKLGRDEQRSLVALLTGESVVLETVAVPAAQRSLLGPDQVVRRCSGDELLASMTTDYASVSRTVAEVAAAWAPLAEEIASLHAGIGGLAAASGPRDAAAGGPRDAAAGGQGDVVQRLTARLDALGSQAAADPLGTTKEVFADLEAALVQARAALSSAGELKAILHERLARARTESVELATLRAQTQQLHERAAVAIAGTPPAPTGLPGDAATHVELCALEALAAAGHVRSVLPRLTALERGLAAARTAFTTAAAHDSAALAERSELRGRFDAYQAMAVRRGVAEDPVLGQLAAGARQHLTTAPCLLPAAASAVAAYQAELAKRSPRSLAG